jgi:hypothetical protein
MPGLSEDGFMCNPFIYDVAVDGTFTPRAASHGNAPASNSAAEKTVVLPPAVCSDAHHVAFRQWLAARSEHVIGARVGILRNCREIVFIDYVCSNAYESNLYFACVAGENKRPAKEMYQHATECRNLCGEVYRFVCHAYILIYQKDDSVWCYRVRE